MTQVVLKWSKWISLILVGLILALLLMVSGLIFTNPGLGLVLWGAEKFVPQLSVGSHSGALLPRFSLNQVTFKDETLNVDLAANSVTLAVNGSCFTEPSVCIDEVAIDGLNFDMPELPASTPEPEPAPVEDNAKITAPLPIKVSRIALSNIDLNILGHQVTWQDFRTGISFTGNRLRLAKTQLDSIQVALAASQPTTSDATESRAVDAPATTDQVIESVPADKVNQQDDPVSAFQLPEIELPHIEIPLQIEVIRLDVNDFELQQESPVIVHHLGLEAFVGGSEVDVKTLELNMPQIEATATTQVTLTNDYPLALDLNALIKEQPVDGQTLKLNATGSIGDLSLDAVFGGLIKGDLTANLKPLNPDLPFDVQLTKTDVQWPLSGESDYQVAIEQFNTQGSLTQYQLELETRIKGKQLPDLDLKLEGQGDQSQIALNNINLDTLGGNVAGDVMANWQARINWAANLTLQHIQPGLQWQEAEGDISGVLSTTGQLTDQGGWAVELSKLDIDGILRDYPLNIEGTLTASDPSGDGSFKANTPQLVLSHGPNSVAAKGSVDKKWSMDLAINFPELSKSVSNLRGRSKGELSLSGDLDKPTVDVALSIDNVDWDQLADVESVRLNGQVTPLPTPNGDLRLSVRNAHYQDYTLDDVDLAFAGSQKAHKASLDVNSNIVSTSLALSGSLQDQPEIAWQGKLERMLVSSQQGEWTLNQATAINFAMATKQVAVAAHCWLQGDSSLCLDQEIKVGESGEASVSLNKFDFAQIKQFIPEMTVVEGEVGANVWAKWSPQNSPEVKASVVLPQGSVTQQIEQPLSLGWHEVTLKATLANNRLDTDWNFDIIDNGDVSGKLTIPDVLIEDKQMDGRLTLSTFNLDFLAPIIGEYSKLKSNITTDLVLSGPVMQPSVNGNLMVDDILLKGDISPVEVDSGRLTVDFSGYDAMLSAAINTPDGQLKMTGDANWADLADWRTNLRIFAEELLVKVPPMVKIKVQPDMTISASPKFARVDGDIALPWGRIVVEELPPSAVGVSKDQVILDDNLKPVEDGQAIPFTLETNINIKIGDDFKLSAFGLEGGLVGLLNVVQKDKGPFITGEINIVEGSYQSFGQDLVINEGKILMNGPADQPYVQISAIRNPDNTQDDVTAGVKVTGPANEPTVTIFSEPAMPQANALSYLLRGQDIDGESGGNAMTTTLIGLSLAKSGRVVGELGEAFGVQDLQLDTAGSGDDSQVTVSGYILPGLQVKYGVGIFDSVGEFTVRYRLMQDLYVEAISGVDSAVDLLYQFEFN